MFLITIKIGTNNYNFRIKATDALTALELVKIKKKELEWDYVEAINIAKYK